MAKKNKSDKPESELASEGILDSLAGAASAGADDGASAGGDDEPVVPPAAQSGAGLDLGKGGKKPASEKAGEGAGKLSIDKGASKAGGKADDKGAAGKVGDKLAKAGDKGAAKGGAKAEPKGGDRTDHEAPGSVVPAEFLAWPVDPEHRSAADVLLSPAADHSIDASIDEEMKPRNAALNFMLLLLILGVAAGGVWQFVRVSSPEALAAKKAEKEQIEQQHLAEQLAKQKKYGVLRIESNPPQAELWLNGERKVNKNETTGVEVVVKTPTNLMDLDISQAYQIRLELPGYEPYEFAVSEHLWTKDAATNEYKFFKPADLTPNVCEYWFLYDAKMKKEVQFKEKADCMTHFDTAVSKQVSVTECTCKIPPEGWVAPATPGSKDDKKPEKPANK